MYKINKVLNLYKNKILSNFKYIQHANITTFKVINYNNNNSYIEGQSFEKTEEVKLSPIKYIVESNKSKEILDEYKSTDGSFKFENLPDNQNINLIVLDESKKYNGKYLENLPVQLDYSKSMKIIRIYQVSNTAHIKINFNGDPSAVAVFVSNATIEKIDAENYKLKGITGSYTVTLHDYVDNVLYAKESTYT